MISEEEMSLLNIKLAKSKRNEKDWSQIKDIFFGKDVFTFKVKKPNDYIGMHRGIAVEELGLLIFTSIKACENYLDELGTMGIISGNINVVGMTFDDVIVLADRDKIDVIIDNSFETNRGYYYYSSNERQLKVVIKTE